MDNLLQEEYSKNGSTGPKPMKKKKKKATTVKEGELPSTPSTSNSSTIELIEESRTNTSLSITENKLKKSKQNMITVGAASSVSTS